MNIDYSKIQTAEQILEINTQLQLDAIKRLKEEAYRTEADPLFFKFQRGEATREEWLAKIEEIRNRFND
jgi:hypothetical protein